jgi:hypothetical protein
MSSTDSSSQEIMNGEGHWNPKNYLITLYDTTAGF